MSESTTVLALVRYVGGSYHGEVISGLMREVDAAGGHVVVVQSAELGDDIEHLSSAKLDLPIAWDQIDGVVSLSLAVDRSYLERLRALGKPVVLASLKVDGFEAPIALPDNDGGVSAAVEHLIAHGHSRIGFVGDMSQHDFRERYAAYRRAMARHRLPADEDLFFPAPTYWESGGAEAGRAVLAAAERPTALVAALDDNAFGVIKALTAGGLSVPNDIAVVGFDDVDRAASSTPSLTTVHQRFDEVGALAGRLVLSLIRGEDVPAGDHVARTAVVIPRRSCGCRSELEDLPTASSPLPAAPRPRATGVPMARGEMGRLLHTLLDDRDFGRLHADTVEAIVQEVEPLLRSDGDLSQGQILQLVHSLHRLAPSADALREIAAALTEVVQRLVSTGAADGTTGQAPAVGRVASAVWQLRTQGILDRSARLESSVLEHADVAADLLGADGDAAQRLEWMARTHARAGMLALWDGPPSDGWLRITGVYDPDGIAEHAVGDRIHVRRFPTADLIGHARLSERQVAMAVPVRTAERKWGVLAVVGVINTGWNREAYYHWADALAATFEAREIQQAMRDSEERYAYAARAANDGLWELDVTTQELYLSARCRDLLGLPASVEATAAAWMSRIHLQDRAGVEEAMSSAARAADVPVEISYRVRSSDGTYRWVLSRGLGVATDNTAVTRVVGSLSDIHRRTELEEQLRHAALYDSLTGLPNRRLFLDRLASALANAERRPGARFAVIFLDLDGFKLINDSLGHHAGDELLTVVGERLRADLRAVDTAARFGGDEFAVLLTDPIPDEVLVIARRIQDSIAASIVLGEHEVSVTASIGIALSESGYTVAEDVLRDADIAMYNAKEVERGTASVFDATMHERALGRLRSRSELTVALEQGQFVVHYQPVVALDGSALTQFEALVRWQHPQRGLLSPGEFLPDMIGNATIVTLGRWLLDEVCRQIAVWRRHYDGPVAVSANVSHREFWSDDLVPTVRAALARHGVPPECLVLEITESVIMSDPEAARHVMAELRGCGIRMHIDDFGTGQSSLHALRTFPVDALKIDGSFVRELALVRQTTALVRTIVDMGAALGLDVVAECVETPEQADELRDMGCANVQGWLYAEAMPGADAGALLGRPLPQTALAGELTQIGGSTRADVSAGMPADAPST